MTAAAKPGQREGGGALDCCALDQVLMEGAVTCVAAVATWTLVRMQGDVLVGKVALRSRVARRFRMHSHLAASVVLLVGVTLLSTLGNDGCASMEHVILLLSSVWVAGTLGGVCTLGTRCILGVFTLGTLCVLGVSEGVATSSKRSGCACT